MRPDQYAELDNHTLDIIYGQHVAGIICDLAYAASGPDCNLYGKCAHYAPDDWQRPQPIGAGGDDYQDAIDAAVRRFGGLQIDTVLLDASRHVVYVTKPTDPKHPGEDTIRSINGAWNHGEERDRWVSVRRCVILCILALAEAPIAYTINGVKP